MVTRRTSLAGISDEGISEKLLSVAREMFARKGYDGTSVQEIVAAAGVTKPVLYYYFRNKEGLYLELLREPFVKLSVFLDEFANKGGSAVKRLEQFCNRLYSLFYEHKELLQLLQGPPPGTPFFNFEDYYQRLWGILGHLIDEAFTRGTCERRNVEERTALILGAVYMASRVRARHRETRKQGERLPKILDVIFKAELQEI